MCIAAGEQEEAERRTQRRKYWVSPYLKERSFKSRYASDFQNLVNTPSMFFENFHMPESSFNALFELVEQYLIPKRNTRPDAIPRSWPSSWNFLLLKICNAMLDTLIRSANNTSEPSSTRFVQQFGLRCKGNFRSGQPTTC
ncbi:uncharacterized protein LOC119559441 [Drosophila subpulchrella]|uniref:uncharacterized protein LOC119559425 n=1 Tax=Drosophila subpulchrella TaxID=1486046 RepID=UPI0018A1A957|nr:uncharacterized protein LOC119559425 [Drosophila subpulchrella]XP_037728469.1 uncharacterized protein LOC119559441 [Drosophila subpulchrella]